MNNKVMKHLGPWIKGADLVLLYWEQAGKETRKWFLTILFEEYGASEQVETIDYYAENAAALEADPILQTDVYLGFNKETQKFDWSTYLVRKNDHTAFHAEVLPGERPLAAHSDDDD